MVRALLLGSLLLAAAPLDTRHAALLDAMSSDQGGMSCTPPQLRAEAADADIRNVGRVDGDDVVVAHLNGGCLCGAHNCPIYALRLTSAKPRILMTSFGYRLTMQPDVPLPRIIVRSHDSALISFEETFAYRGGAYVQAENARVRNDTGARKPDIPVHFAPGASSAQLHGTASRDWFDAYTFDAHKGQVLRIDGVRSGAKVDLLLLGPGGRTGDIPANAPYALFATGTYGLRVQPRAEQAVPYALTLAITNQPLAPAHESSAGAAAERPAPDAALLRWAQAIPVVRCVPFAFGSWLNTRSEKDTTGVPITLVGGKKFAQNGFSGNFKLTRVAGIERPDSDRYDLGRVPQNGAAVMGFDGAGGEDSFVAVIAATAPPPRAVVALPAAPRAGGTIGLGSTRPAVESALGPGRSKPMCGFDVVHYSQSEPRASVAEMWFFYRGGVVAAIARSEGV